MKTTVQAGAKASRTTSAPQPQKPFRSLAETPRHRHASSPAPEAETVEVPEQSEEGSDQLFVTPSLPGLAGEVLFEIPQTLAFFSLTLMEMEPALHEVMRVGQNHTAARWWEVIAMARHIVRLRVLGGELPEKICFAALPGLAGMMSFPLRAILDKMSEAIWAARQTLRGLIHAADSATAGRWVQLAEVLAFAEDYRAQTQGVSASALAHHAGNFSDPTPILADTFMATFEGAYHLSARLEVAG